MQNYLINRRLKPYLYGESQNYAAAKPNYIHIKQLVRQIRCKALKFYLVNMFSNGAVNDELHDWAFVCGKGKSYIFN